ncbi:MAG: hypothetical protein JWQ35_95, partial [Bacteriovoracaceae bacterium]|nr:hypothetical protein [Bacteriovoracaceae bacterium]
LLKILSLSVIIPSFMTASYAQDAEDSPHVTDESKKDQPVFKEFVHGSEKITAEDLDTGTQIPLTSKDETKDSDRLVIFKVKNIPYLYIQSAKGDVSFYKLSKYFTPSVLETYLKNIDEYENDSKKIEELTADMKTHLDKFMEELAKPENKGKTSADDVGKIAPEEQKKYADDQEAIKTTDANQKNLLSKLSYKLEDGNIKLDSNVLIDLKALKADKDLAFEKVNYSKAEMNALEMKAKADQEMMIRKKVATMLMTSKLESLGTNGVFSGSNGVLRISSPTEPGITNSFSLTPPYATTNGVAVDLKQDPKILIGIVESNAPPSQK